MWLINSFDVSRGAQVEFSIFIVYGMKLINLMRLIYKDYSIIILYSQYSITYVFFLIQLYAVAFSPLFHFVHKECAYCIGSSTKAVHRSQWFSIAHLRKHLVGSE